MHRWSVRVAAVAGGLAWLALALQLHLTTSVVLAQGRTFLDSLFVLFGYFTVITNVLVAIAFTALAVQPIGPARVLVRPGVLTGVAASIALVGIVYSLFLRNIWHPTGAQFVADELLHDVIPIVFLLYWWLWVPKAGLRWRDALLWALYPLAYVSYALIRGAATGTYPYPFIDVGQIGYGVALRNALMLLAGFLAISAILIALGRWKDPCLRQDVRNASGRISEHETTHAGGSGR